jgi:hypothetical protein
MRRSTSGFCLLLGLAACASSGSSEDALIKSYYERHASEQNGYCPSPYIDGITRQEVVEESADRMVLEVGYLYRDRSKSGSNMGQLQSECVSYASRRFVLQKSGDTFEVVEMGPSSRDG